MKDYEKYHGALNEINSVDEVAVKNALEKAGLYSKAHTFPLLHYNLN